MCGRYATGTLSWEQYVAILSLIPGQPRWNVEPNYDVRPTDTAPVVVEGEGGLEMRPMRWGFFAPWMAGKGLSTFNARADKLNDSALWRPAFDTRRALVPAVAFYEWTGEKTNRRRLAIGARFGQETGDASHNFPLFCFAGLWMCAQGEAGPVESFTIVTTDPSPGFSALHHREALILPPQDWRRWLASRAEAERLLVPLPDADKTILEVDPKARGQALLQAAISRDLFR
jgi:putative SOS response-associated peptidase YedK